MSIENIENKDGRIKWGATGNLAQLFSSERPCNLCKEREGTEYRKGHKRLNGIMLEKSWMYCKECVENKPEEVETNFEQSWDEAWAKCEAIAEKNWQEHGIYTNVSNPAVPSGLSTHFAYVKLEDGRFKPYRYVHPNNDRDRFEGELFDAKDEIGQMPISDKEKFDAILKFLSEYETDDQLVKNMIESRIKEIEEIQNDNS